MPLRPDMDPGEFLDILRRRKWVILFSFLLTLFGATAYCVLATELFRSTAKILIIPPAVGTEMVRSTLNLSTKDRLILIQQDILSRTRLKAVIDEMGLLKKYRNGTSEDVMVGVMRKRINMAIDRNNTFTLSFDDENPIVARDVTSRLASFIIEENIKSRGAATQDTSTFLASQLGETRIKLEQQEEKIKRYKLQFGGELPQQEQANLNRLQRLQDQIKNHSETIARLQDRKVFMEAQVSSLESSIRSGENRNPWEDTGLGKQTQPGKLLSELAMRRKKLEELQEKYTPLHPAVVQARWEVEQLEARMARLRREADAGTKGSKPAASSSQSMSEIESTGWERGELKRLRDQVAAIDLEIVALKRESANAARTIDETQRKVERLPQREQELVSMTRDYDNIKKSYEDLLKKKLEANISENLEEKQKGEKFQVLEPANLPYLPYKPNRVQVLGLALIASLVIGAGVAIGLEMMDPTLRGSREFRNFFDLPVLATLPVIQDDRYRRRIAIRRAAVIGGLVSIMGGYLVFLVVHGEKIRSILQSIGQTIGGGN